MRISSELKEKTISLNRTCFIISIVMNIIVCICLWGVFKTIIYDGFDTYSSTARSLATLMVIASIAVNSLFLTLCYNIINIYITSKDVIEVKGGEA